MIPNGHEKHKNVILKKKTKQIRHNCYVYPCIVDRYSTFNFPPAPPLSQKTCYKNCYFWPTCWVPEVNTFNHQVCYAQGPSHQEISDLFNGKSQKKCIHVFWNRVVQLLQFLEENYLEAKWQQKCSFLFESLTGGSPYSLNTLQSNTAPLLGAGPTLESLQSIAAASCVLSML